MISFASLQQQAATALKLVSDLAKNIEAASAILSTTELEDLRRQQEQIHAKAMAVSEELDKALAEAEKR